MANKNWMPEITYEESDGEEGQLGNLPLVHVPPDENMPLFLMMWEARDTGELEPGLEGEDVPVVEWELRQYARMDVLKSKLSPPDYDKVRCALGLEPLALASAKGSAITQQVRENLAAQQELATTKKNDLKNEIIDRIMEKK